MLVMDVFEHAFMIDFGLKRADYIEAFFEAIDWTIDPDTDKWMFKWMRMKNETGSKKYESSTN
jgi:hypothetical protein